MTTSQDHLETKTFKDNRNDSIGSEGNPPGCYVCVNILGCTTLTLLLIDFEAKLIKFLTDHFDHLYGYLLRDYWPNRRSENGF